MDAAHRATDEELLRIEKRLTEIYNQAAQELQEKADKYFERFKVLDAQKRVLVDAGKMSEADYKKWRQGKVMTGKHWTEMRRQAAQRLTEADKTAAEYVNGRLPHVYSLNYNKVAEALETRLAGYSFEMVSEETVRHLAIADRKLLPARRVDVAKDMRWNMQMFQAETLQGILQGESMDKIAKRIFPEIMKKADKKGKTEAEMKGVTKRARDAAIRNARTMVTGAENKGRIDMLHDAREKGVIADKIWIAAHDSRTREAHLDLDGQQVPEDEAFDSSLGKIEYPGDPDAAPANVYNCRCTLTYKVVGFGGKNKEPSIAGVERGEPMTFEEADSGRVNPHFEDGGGYRINCQSCVATYEARLRGYDVEVVPNDAYHPMCKKLANDTSLIWKNADGTKAEYVVGNGKWTWKNAWEGDSPTAKRFEKRLLEVLDEEGRYHLQFKWQGFNSGHIVTIGKEKDSLVIYDPQSNRTFRGENVSEYLSRMQYKRQYKGNTYYAWPNVMRVDDKQFDFDLANEVMIKAGVNK